MALKIVRNDITRMNTETIVNTANDHPAVGSGCDFAVYTAAGIDELLAYRKEMIGFVPEGEVFLTPGFKLKTKHIIHAVSPRYIDGSKGEEKKLRACYRNSLKLAKKKGFKSISFPLISSGGFGYPKEEAMRIAVDEIRSFLQKNDMLVYLVVFDEKSKEIGEKQYRGIEEYIDRNYVEQKIKEEYTGHALREDTIFLSSDSLGDTAVLTFCNDEIENVRDRQRDEHKPKRKKEKNCLNTPGVLRDDLPDVDYPTAETIAFTDFVEEHESKLKERISHLSDTFSQYLIYLINEKGLSYVDVYKSAIIDKKVFSKIRNNAGYHPQKLTALCLCIGARLNLDESKDLLSRAGYALSPCDKTDIIFSYFIENEIYDMIELDIQLEEHGLPCIIT